MKVLVTGGAGYIGSILVPELVARNYQVTVVDNFLFKQASLNQLCRFSNFTVFNQDVRLTNEMRRHYSAADIIIPLAGLVGAPLCSKDPIGAETTNSVALRDMLAQLSKDQLLLMPTTNSAYGTGNHENYCDEASKLNPISSYAKAKVEIEDLLMARDNSISFRLATVFGMSPKMRLDLLVNDFVYRAVNDRFIVLFEGQFKRNYIHVFDVARTFLHGIDNFNTMRNQIYNVGLSDANLSKIELCERIARRVPSLTVLEAPAGRDPDQRNYIVSNAKLEGTGWRPTICLDTGIEELINGYKMLKRSEFSNV